VGAMLLAKLLGLENWRSVVKFKSLGQKSLSELLEFAKERLHTDHYTREEVCGLLGFSDDELSTKCLTENTRHLGPISQSSISAK
jgi:hypothetical protein